MFLLSLANYVHNKENCRGSFWNQFFQDSSLYLKFITEKGKEIKPQNGYRQLGLIGSFVSDVNECLNANDKVSQQNYIQLATKVFQLTMR